MIRTLAETTKVNQEQDWLKTNVARFTRMLQGQRDLLTVARQILNELAPLVNAHHGAFYMAETDDEGPMLKLFASYAYQERKTRLERVAVRPGPRRSGGARGQAHRRHARCPPDYIQITSALGEAPPHAIVVVPILFEGEVKGVIELASFERFSGIQLAFLDQMLESPRHRDRDDRGDDAHRRAAAPVAEPHRGAAQRSRKSCSRPTRSSRRRPSSSPSRRPRSRRRTSRSSSLVRSSRRRRSSSR